MREPFVLGAAWGVGWILTFMASVRAGLTERTEAGVALTAFFFGWPLGVLVVAIYWLDRRECRICKWLYDRAAATPKEGR